jgi:hypothetical protein
LVNAAPDVCRGVGLVVVVVVTVQHAQFRQRPRVTARGPEIVHAERGEETEESEREKDWHREEEVSGDAGES